jgi:phospholipase C
MQREGQCVQIHARFNVPVLTKQDAAQINMTQFFNFNFPPWMTPPTPPVQTTVAPAI